MKLSGLYILLLSICIISCKHDPESISVYVKPQLFFVNSDSLISKDTVVQSGVSIRFKLNCQCDSSLLLSRLLISRTTSNTTEFVLDSAISSQSISVEIESYSSKQEIKETWIVELTDNMENTITESIEITTLTLPIAIEFDKSEGFIYNDAFMSSNDVFTTGIRAYNNTISDCQLSKFQLIKYNNNIPAILIDSSIYCSTFNFTTTLNAPLPETSEKWVFKIFDEIGQSDSIGYNIYTYEDGLLVENYTGVLYNALGDSSYIWDLVNNKPRNINDDDSVKDMVNSTLESAYEPYYFDNGWHSRNRTKFVLATNKLDYDNATLHEAIDAYSGGSIMTVLTYTYWILKGDVFVTKLRNTDRFVVIKVTNIVYTPDDNYDKVEFTYKK